jgi:signal transduction histidine kinase
MIRLQYFRKIFPHRISHQISLILIIFVTILLVLQGILMIHTSQSTFKESILENHRHISSLAAIDVESFLKGPMSALEFAAAMLSTMHTDAWRQETVLVELALRYSMFRRISFVDENGWEVASSQLGSPRLMRLNEMGFTAGMRGETFISDVYIAEDHSPMMTWAVPIRYMGSVRGVLLADVTIRGVWDIVDSIQIGRAGRALLVNREGYLLAYPDKKQVLANERFWQKTFGWDVPLGLIGSRETRDTEGREILISYAPIQGVNWVLAIVQSGEEAFAFRETMHRQAWGLMVVSLLGAILLSMGISRIISDPINRLIAATRRIAESDFDQPLKTSRVDEMGELFMAYNQMMKKLKAARRMERLSTIGQSATVIAHELKNSLVLIKAYVQLLPERYQDEEFIKELSKVVPRELGSWQAMIEDMMDYSRLDQFACLPVEIQTLFDDLIPIIEEMARQSGRQFQWQIPSNLPIINGHIGRLRQSILNLLANAFEATPEGGIISLKVIAKEQAGGALQISIKDSGVGIPLAEMEKIFEPFYTTKSSGLGLGLTICREIIERHNGTIQVASLPGEGTEFRIELPIPKDLPDIISNGPSKLTTTAQEERQEVVHS